MLDHPVKGSHAETIVLGHLHAEAPRRLAWPTAAAGIIAISVVLWGMIAAAASALGLI